MSISSHAAIGTATNTAAGFDGNFSGAMQPDDLHSFSMPRS